MIRVTFFGESDLERDGRGSEEEHRGSEEERGNVMMIYESSICFGRRGRYQTANFVPYINCVSRELQVPSRADRALLLRSVVVVSPDGSRSHTIEIDDTKMFLPAMVLCTGASLHFRFERRDRRFTRPIRIRLAAEAIQHEPLRVDPQWGNGGSDGSLSHR